MTELRLATHHDQAAVIQLIDSVLQEYNDQICLEGAESDLLDIEGQYFGRGGAFWVLSDPGSQQAPRQSQKNDFRVIGCHAAIGNREQPEVCNFKRLYLAPAYRGGSGGQQLMQVAIDWARESGFTRIEFWSDTRFERAHRFFRKFGFQKSGQVRAMHDSHAPYQEYFFWLDLTTD